ncbi:MAG: TlyA family rRNA (cytidine-2'-O)-methyltransferase [Frankiales bacterium]|nr:TlyA family rRNA (cytidine-2'-O)-methyltransferase [Frankiales bacterium]
MSRRRLDAELVRRGLARSREHAQSLVADGRVLVGGVRAVKPATQVDAATSLVVREAQEGPDYVSRGAHKLVGALDAFGLDVTGRIALDAGASTGGFTDVLLRRGVASVVAVDVGYGQLAWSIRSDPRVTVLERTNVRDLRPGDLDVRPDLVVADLSFISLSLVLAPLAAVVTDDADLVLMVKPQFEVGKEQVGPGGVVRDPALRSDAVRRIAAAALALGLGTAGVVASPLPGPSGNVEYFLHLRRGAGPLADADLARAVEEGPR